MKMSGSIDSHRVRRDDVESAAAAWVARRNGGPLNASEAAALDTWLAADTRHAQALVEMEEAWTMLNTPRWLGQADAVAIELGRRSRRRRIRLQASLGFGLAAAAAILFVAHPWHHTVAPSEPLTASIVARPDVRALPDGSTIELNLGAEYLLEFTSDVRAVRLVRGEALFVVHKDPARSFVVRAGNIEVRAVGTAFVIRHDSKHINVLVTEGEVAVERSAPAPDATEPADRPRPAPVHLETGRQILVPLNEPAVAPLDIRVVSADELAAALAWQNKRIEFKDTRLVDAVKLFNRQNAVELVLTDAALGRRRVTGIFWSDDPEGFVRLLETGFGARASRSGDVITLRSD